MAVEEELHAWRCGAGRDVDEFDLKAFTFEIENVRPGRIAVAVAADNAQRRAAGSEQFADALFADIPEVPDFFRFADRSTDVPR